LQVGVSMVNQSFDQVARKTITDQAMLKTGDSVVVAVSGGPDSVALLSLLVELQSELDLSLHVWHLNHLLRPEAAREADWVKRLAADLGLDCSVDVADVKNYGRERGLSVQEAGRETRYRLLGEVARRIGAGKIALGHHADDSAETFFINLLRGTGPAGLAGIPPTAGQVVRPLINCRRDWIVAYLAAKGIEYLRDPSNLDRGYRRNRIRLDLMPVLTAINPSAVERMLVTMGLLRDDEAWLGNRTRQSFNLIAARQAGEVSLPLEFLRRSLPALGRRVVRLALSELYGSEKALDYPLIESIMVETVRRGGEVNLPKGGKAITVADRLVVYLPGPPLSGGTIGPQGGAIEIDRGRLSVTIAPVGEAPGTARPGLLWADADKVVWPLEVRSWRPADQFQPLGMTGHKKMSDFFIDSKVPRHRRSRIPILADQEKIVAVGDLRLDERVKVTETTRRLALIKMAPAADI
jgi:tRNA(Ile)-lysidine synthase